MHVEYNYKEVCTLLQNKVDDITITHMQRCANISYTVRN